MDALEGLLSGPASELRRLGRAALVGLRAALRAGLDAAPDDPARPAVLAFLGRLEPLLGGVTDAAPVAVPAEPAGPDPWAALRQRLAASHEWRAGLGNPDVGDGPEMPARVAALTWRLPPDAAEAWRRQFPPSAEGEPVVVAGPVATPLLPALPSDPRPVRMSPDGPADARLGGAAAGEIAARAAAVASACLWMSDHDRTLSHMVRSVFRFGLVPLADAQLPRYQRALAERWERLRQTEQDGDGAGLVLAWLDLDEAVNGLLHQPPAHPQSLFAALGRASRDLLAAVRAKAEALGASVHVQVLSGRYQDLHGFTQADADVEASGGPPGEVVHCARAYCKLDGRAMPGRVVYRPR